MRDLTIWEIITVLVSVPFGLWCIWPETKKRMGFDKNKLCCPKCKMPFSDWFVWGSEDNLITEKQGIWLINNNQELCEMITVKELKDQLEKMPEDYRVICGCGADFNIAENQMEDDDLELRDELVILFLKEE